jgi:hypothetical protein
VPTIAAEEKPAATAPAEANAVPALVGDVWDGGRSPAVHRITLYDDQGFGIFPGVDFNQPFSTAVTCGKCHQVDPAPGLPAAVSKGWHFSAGRDANSPGRPGEPWIYWDCPTGTQIPLSYRRWAGTFEPNQIGLSDWWFIRVFGRQMPGGGVGVPDAASQVSPGDRWSVSGSLEINCLSCHDVEPAHDQSLYGQQIGVHNYRWAAAATSGIATIQGTVKDLPDTWQKGDRGEVPSVAYDASRFLPDNKVVLQIRRHMPNERCLFCHSTSMASETSDNRSIDVHVAAGMQCVDCHSNGLDHAISRGYETEARDVNEPRKAPLSCKGCHLGKDAAGMGTTRYHAPYPLHRGIPVIHFEKLACTACHSGPQPGDRAVATRTSRAHALGTHKANLASQTLPHIQAPVFAPGSDGKIAPHKLIWPAYWGQMRDGQVTPLPLDLVKTAGKDLLPHELQLANASWPAFTDRLVRDMLKSLASTGQVSSPVYVCGGKVYQIAGSELTAVEHDAARPYLWPMAHDVRPARQSLGAHVCQDCHSVDAGLVAGRVAVDGPLADPNASLAMVTFERLDPTLTSLFSRTFIFRPFLKIVSLAAATLIVGLIVVFALRALHSVSKAAAELQTLEEDKDNEEESSR